MNSRLQKLLPGTLVVPKNGKASVWVSASNNTSTWLEGLVVIIGVNRFNGSVMLWASSLQCLVWSWDDYIVSIDECWELQ